MFLGHPLLPISIFSVCCQCDYIVSFCYGVLSMLYNNIIYLMKAQKTNRPNMIKNWTPLAHMLDLNISLDTCACMTQVLLASFAESRPNQDTLEHPPMQSMVNSHFADCPISCCAHCPIGRWLYKLYNWDLQHVVLVSGFVGVLDWLICCNVQWSSLCCDTYVIGSCVVLCVCLKSGLLGVSRSVMFDVTWYDALWVFMGGCRP